MDFEIVSAFLWLVGAAFFFQIHHSDGYDESNFDFFETELDDLRKDDPADVDRKVGVIWLVACLAIAVFWPVVALFYLATDFLEMVSRGK